MEQHKADRVGSKQAQDTKDANASIWVVVKIMVPFWVLIIIRHLLFRVPQKVTIILTTTHIKAFRELHIHGEDNSESPISVS